MPSPKRHHFVPEMLLRRFSTEPTSKNAPIASIELATGRVRRSSVRNEAAISHHNRLEGTYEHASAASIEHAYSLIEQEGGNAIDRLLQGAALTLEDRQMLALFVFMQHQRTPRGRQWMQFFDDRMSTMQVEVSMTDPGWSGTRERPPGVSVDEIERYRQETLEGFRSGELFVSRGWDFGVLAPFEHAEALSKLLASQMRFVLCLAPAGAEFVLADHPVHLYDPGTPKGLGVSWFSSPRVQISMPLARNAVLILHPGGPSTERITADDEDALDLNLRQYANASWRIFGSGQRALQEIRHRAKRSPRKLHEFRVRAPQFTVLEDRGSGVADSATVYRPPAQPRPDRFPR